MTQSPFLAQLIGLSFLVLGLSITLAPNRIRKIGQEFMDSDALIFTSGILALVAGLAIVLNHNIWRFDWQGVITLIGWIATLAGISRLIAGNMMKPIGTAMLDRPILIRIPGLFMVLLGGWLAYVGFSN